MKYSLEYIAQYLGAKLIGEPQLEITAVSPLNSAEKNALSFLSDPKYIKHIESSNASAIIVNEKVAESVVGNLLVMNDPYLGYAKVAQLFDTTPQPKSGIQATAIIAETAVLGENVSIGHHVVIESGVSIGNNVVLEPGVSIGENTVIGDNTRVYPNTVIYHGVTIGKNCLIQANAVIGSDGFGYANDKGAWVKIPQVGGVIIGDNVEIGAHTAIDRGALEDTIIEDGVILDNHIHIAHNVKIGKCTAIAGTTAVAGSTTIGQYCTIAGRVSIIGHLTICDKAHITATTFVNKSITEPGAYSSGTTLQTNRDWHKSTVRFRQLDDMWRKMKQLEKELNQLNAQVAATEQDKQEEND